jgi:hypothetical protein
MGSSLWGQAIPRCKGSCRLDRRAAGPLPGRRPGRARLCFLHLLEGFWDEARAHGLPLPTEDPTSAASFCAARHKITSDLLKHVLLQIAATAFGEGSICNQRWHGRRVFALDAAKLNMQRGDDLERAFGVPEGAYCLQVLVSILIDEYGAVAIFQRHPSPSGPAAVRPSRRIRALGRSPRFDGPDT